LVRYILSFFGAIFTLVTLGFAMIALIVGVMPVVGNLAFPLQIIFTSAHANAKVAQFIVYDTFSRLGQSLPIWGGSDTYTEHLCNRLPDWLMRHRLKSESRGELAAGEIGRAHV